MIETGPLIAVALLATALAVIAQRASRRARRELELLTLTQADPRSTVLPPNALDVRLARELEWAAATGKPVGLAVFHLIGAEPDRAATQLRSFMRGGEIAYHLHLNEFVVAFWDSDAIGTHRAIQRLGRIVEGNGAQLVEAGPAAFPEDGTTPDELILCARARRAPLDFVEPMPEGPRTTRLPWQRDLALPTALRFVFLAAALVVLGLLSDWWSDRDSVDGAARVALAAGLSLVVGALGWITAHLAGAASDSLPVVRRASPAARTWAPLWAVATAATFCAALLLPSSVALSVVTLAVLVLGLASLRELVHVDLRLLCALAAAGAAVVLLTRHGDTDIANTGRLLVAAAAGCGAARALERWGWSAWLMIGAAGLDMWSVWSSDGITRELATVGSAAGASGSRSVSSALSLDDLLFVGPSLDGTPSFQLGTSDLLLVTMCIATAHVWRLGVRTVAVFLLVALGATLAWSMALDDLVPAIPVLAIAYLVALGVRRIATGSSTIARNPPA